MLTGPTTGDACSAACFRPIVFFGISGGIMSETVLVTLESSAGKIELELFPGAAPITVTNFLHYVETGAYEGGTFHRTVTMQNQPNNEIKIEVIQAGINPERTDEIGDPIPLERTSLTGLKHLDGTISMGRSTPDSADIEIFICIGDQPELDFGGRRNPDGQGFAAFGRVTGGMDVVRAIQQSPHEEQKLTPPIQIKRIVRHG
jgi:peptidyl-prolyl cis-trans isomerase A (cyclophilin A)